MSNIDSKPTISLILPWFCEHKRFSAFRRKNFPNYFDYFLRTFSRNQKIELKIFTNVPFQKYTNYGINPPIRFYKMSLKECFKLCQKKLDISGFEFKDFRSYKLCDFKPMYGNIFAEYLEDCEYWGYCDPDMIVGNLDLYLDSSSFSAYDLITGTSHLVGYMTLFRNNEMMNNLAQKSPDYLRVINSSKNYRFDECGKENIVALEQLLSQENVNVSFLNNCVHNDCGKINIDREWEYLWNNGSLIDCLTKSEIGALHLVKSKKNSGFLIEPLKNENSFLISRKGIKTLQRTHTP